MPNETKQPFQGDQPRKTDDTKLVAEVLGTTEAAEMEELLGQNEKPVVERATETPGLTLSEDEKAAVSEANKTKAELRHDEYVVWAKEIGKDEDWIDGIFIFENDGRVRVEGDLDLSIITSSIQMPPKLVEVGGDLDLNSLTSAEHLTLPDTIGGSLYLDSLTSAEHLTLPNTVGSSLILNRLTSAEYLTLPDTIGSDLWLVGLTEGLVPVGCGISGKVYLKKNQTAIIDDARAKGYDVVER